jgi:radical SAM protein with 4Fe4S-binding SPASM domain
MSQTMTVAARSAHVFDRAPVMLYWEITRACDLACKHCRADALPCRDPGELDFLEAIGLLSQITDFGSPLPHLVITGGDPLKRRDLEDIVKEAVRLGIPTSLAPSATPLLTSAALAKLQRAGLSGLSLSLDGSMASGHDRLRGVVGCFARTLTAARAATNLGLSLQINTLVSAQTLPDLPGIYALLQTLPIQRWSLFFLIGVGRGSVLQNILPEQAEQACHWLFTKSREASFTVAATEAPFFRRVALERANQAGPFARSFGIRDGNGIAFVSHRGAVQPSGFLPVVAGNVRDTSLVDLYRTAPLFSALRDTAQLRGKCARCSFKAICGGSRARAYAHSGDYLGADPLCAYQPSTGPLVA